MEGTWTINAYRLKRKRQFDFSYSKWAFSIFFYKTLGKVGECLQTWLEGFTCFLHLSWLSWINSVKKLRAPKSSTFISKSQLLLLHMSCTFASMSSTFAPECSTYSPEPSTGQNIWLEQKYWTLEQSTGLWSQSTALWSKSTCPVLLLQVQNFWRLKYLTLELSKFAWKCSSSSRRGVGSKWILLEIFPYIP